MLKLLGESAGAPPAGVDRAVAVCPPIDLEVCCRALCRGIGRWYDRHFVSLLMRQLDQAARRRGERAAPSLARRPRTLFEFDDFYTAPVSGFTSAEHYYSASSAAAFVARIGLPTTVLVAQDDPVVPHAAFGRANWSSAVRLVETRHGGHLGFIGRRGADPDRCWMDWRVVDWVVN